jgi:hypothetical protein
LPLSMFTVIGLIGMSGIIINDSIVLVTTVDEYSKERGLTNAIIDGATDRLRPVVLTTLTTVIGLMPLLYEPSRQAQFLKPTVITLVYGLGFGLFLVLLIVPALLAMQQDIRRQFQALRRATDAPGRTGLVGKVSWLGVLGLLAIFGATMGATMITGTVFAPIALFVPSLAETATLGAAFGLFLMGAVVWLFALFFGAMLAGGLGTLLRNRANA